MRKNFFSITSCPRMVSYRGYELALIFSLGVFVEGASGGHGSVNGRTLGCVMNFMSVSHLRALEIKSVGGVEAGKFALIAGKSTCSRCSDGILLRLRGGGQRKLIRLRGERRRAREAEYASKAGIDKIKPLPRYRKPHAQRISERGGPPKDFQEHAKRSGRWEDKPDWKIAELRLRAKDDAPWTKWRGWNMNQTMEYYQDLEEGLDSGNDDEPVEQKKSVWRESAKLRLTHEEWLDDETSLRKVNDGKGNIDFEGVDDIPKNITDINEKCRWFEANCIPDNRYLTAEDLREEQRHTETVKAETMLHKSVNDFLGMYNVTASQELPLTAKNDDKFEASVKRVDRLGEELRKTLKLNPGSPDALATYGIYLSEMQQDPLGAEKICKRAFKTDPKHTHTLCNYAILLRDSVRDIEAAHTLLERAKQAGPNDEWYKMVAAEKEWKETVTVRAGRPGARMDGKKTEQEVDGSGVRVGSNLKTKGVGAGYEEGEEDVGHQARRNGEAGGSVTSGRVERDAVDRMEDSQRESDVGDFLSAGGGKQFNHHSQDDEDGLEDDQWVVVHSGRSRPGSGGKHNQSEGGKAAASHGIQLDGGVGDKILEDFVKRSDRSNVKEEERGGNGGKYESGDTRRESREGKEKGDSGEKFERKMVDEEGRQKGWREYEGGSRTRESKDEKKVRGREDIGIVRGEGKTTLDAQERNRVCVESEAGSVSDLHETERPRKKISKDKIELEGPAPPPPKKKKKKKKVEPEPKGPRAKPSIRPFERNSAVQIEQGGVFRDGVRVEKRPENPDDPLHTMFPDGFERKD